MQHCLFWKAGRKQSEIECHQRKKESARLCATLSGFTVLLCEASHKK